MKTVKTLSPELLGADAAMRRATIKVKLEADRIDSVAGKPVFNRTVTLRDAWQK